MNSNHKKRFIIAGIAVAIVIIGLWVVFHPRGENSGC
jgi:hypothetical protein